MEKNPYKKLAERLDALPNGFPPTDDGVELEMLARLFTPEEAGLASQLRLTKEIPEQVAKRLGRDTTEVRALLKGMARKGLIACRLLSAFTRTRPGALTKNLRHCSSHTTGNLLRRSWALSHSIIELSQLMRASK